MTIEFILVVILIGAIAGFAARFLVPGNDSMGAIATVILGIVGAFVGTLIASLFGEDKETAFVLEPISIILAIIGAVVALLVWRAVNGRSRTSV